MVTVRLRTAEGEEDVRIVGEEHDMAVAGAEDP